MDDTIYRQAAIDSIAHATFDVIIGGRRGFQNYKEEFEKAFVGIRDKYIEALKALPSAEPERIRGKWIVDGHHIQCNVCHVYMCDTDREGDSIPQNFCPNCGAEMEQLKVDL